MTWAMAGVFALGMFCGMGWGYVAGVLRDDDYRSRRKKRRRIDPTLLEKEQ